MERRINKLLFAHVEEYGDSDEMKEYIGDCVENEEESTNEHLFISAAEYGNYDKVNQYVQDGININAEDKFGYTALMMAVENSHARIVRFLIKNGASFYIDSKCKVDVDYIEYRIGKSRESENSFRLSSNSYDLLDMLLGIQYISGGRDMSAEERVKFPCIERDIKRRINEELFRYAAEQGDYEEVKQCVQDGININAAEELGDTAIIMAVRNGHVEIVRFLVKNGASFYIVYDYSATELSRTNERGFRMIKPMEGNRRGTEHSIHKNDRAGKISRIGKNSKTNGLLDLLLDIQAINEDNINIPKDNPFQRGNPFLRKYYEF